MAQNLNHENNIATCQLQWAASNQLYTHKQNMKQQNHRNNNLQKQMMYTSRFRKFGTNTKIKNKANNKNNPNKIKEGEQIPTDPKKAFLPPRSVASSPASAGYGCVDSSGCGCVWGDGPGWSRSAFCAAATASVGISSQKDFDGSWERGKGHPGGYES